MVINKEILQQVVKVKKQARSDGFALDIPTTINKPFIKKDAIASVSISQDNNKFSIIYEFDIDQ